MYLIEQLEEKLPETLREMTRTEEKFQIACISLQMQNVDKVIESLREHGKKFYDDDWDARTVLQGL